MTSSPPVDIRWDSRELTAQSSGYTWVWNQDSDILTISDHQGRRIVSGPLQPAITLAERTATPGVCTDVQIAADEVTWRYSGVNASGEISMSWRFTSDSFWVSPISYTDPVTDDVVSLLWFADWVDGVARPGLYCAYLVHPGASESSALGPVIPSKIRLDATTWLGRGSNDCTDIIAQQWGLPIHYFGGFTIRGSMVERDALIREVSDSFCCGLAEIPHGDLLLRHHGEKISPLLLIQSDLWRHVRTGSGPITLGTSWVWTVQPSYREAIEAYYRELVRHGVVTPRERSAAQEATLQRSQFNTWGAQCASGWALRNFSETALRTIYADVRASGMNPGIFVIDDMWEGEYGLLQHDEERFPGFEDFLDTVRSDGHQVGLWAAFLRCDRPESNGLTVRHMLCGPDGEPVTRGNHGHMYYLFDVSHPEVQEVLRRRARAFMERYRPDLVKFDFGYELPSMRFAAPANREWGGELLLLKALQLVIGAMREVNPDVVVMYYNLSPLLHDYVDLHSTDDMYLCADEYQLEANRRLYFSSALGHVGVPSYGSGGYEWLRMQDIWFDSAVMGPLGSLGSFRGDPRASSPTALDIARFRGLSRLTRSTTTFAIRPLGEFQLGGSMAARAGSWVRTEGPAEDVMMAALRTRNLDNTPLAAHLPEVVATDGDIVIASLTEQPLNLASRLGFVPCTEQPQLTVTLLGRSHHHVSAIVHYLDGTSAPQPVHPVGADAVITINTTGGDHPIEWVELTAELRGE